MFNIKNLIILFFFSVSFLFAQDNIKDVTILHWNDFHAHNTPYKISKKDTATGDTLYYYIGGTASMLGYLNKYRDSKSLVLNAGDDFQGSPISNITRGRSQIKLLNLYKPDAFTIGNHEFDYGQYSLDSALQLADFDYLSANIFFNSKNRTFGSPYVVKEINGVKFGIIGITTPDLPNVSIPSNIDNLTLLNPDSVITAAITELKSQGCDVIVLLTHCGVDYDKKLAEKFYPDVDIIVGGHSHTPLFKPINDKGVIIVQAGSYARWLGKLEIKIDTEKDTVIEYSGKLIETVLDSAAFDLNAANTVESMLATVSPELNRVIGKVLQDWKGSYSEESNLGQYEASAFKNKTKADIGFINGGGLRKSLLKGDIKVTDIWEINPFGNEVMTFTVSGKTLKQMLLNNLISRLTKGTEMTHSSGIDMTYDSRKVSDPTSLITEIKINGKFLEPDKTYKIATNNYIATQFKKFFGDIDETISLTDTGLIDRDVIIELVEKDKVIKGDLERHIIDISSK